MKLLFHNNEKVVFNMKNLISDEDMAQAALYCILNNITVSNAINNVQSKLKY